MPTLIEIKDALDEGLIGGALRKKLHLHEDIKGPLFPPRTPSKKKTTLNEHMKGMVPLLPTREPNPQSFRNSPEHNPEPNNRALDVPTETFIRYLDRHEKSEITKTIKAHLEELESFHKWIDEEIDAGRIEDREDHEEIYRHGTPYDGFDHELTNFDHRLTKLGLIDYRKEWDTDKVLLPVPYALNEWLEKIARQYRSDAFVGFGGYVEIPEVGGIDSDRGLGVGYVTEQVHEDDQWEGEDEEAEGTSRTPFTKKEIAILNFIGKNFSPDDLNQISTSTDLYPYSGEINKRWKDAMKLFGHPMPEGWGEMEKKAEAATYAKWALDNWDEENRGEDGEMDYSKVTNPIKVLPKWYEVDYDETVSQVEFRSGSVDLIAFDEDDALYKGEREFFDWGGKTEVDDYGDSERFDHETTSAEYQRLAEEVIKETLREQERDKDSWSDEDLDGSEQSPFTPLEGKILNVLAQNFTRDELKSISTETYPYGPDQLAQRWVDTMKLFGHTTSPGSGSMDEKVKTSKYAKWASDNWDVAEAVGGDYSKIKMPFKSLPKLYDITYDETASQIEYRRGETEVVAFDEDDATSRGEAEFYDWDGEVDTYDYGDQDVHDSEITDVKYKGLAESNSSLSDGPKTDEEITQFLDNTYKDKFLKLYRLYIIGKEHGEKLVGGVSDANIKQFLKEAQFILYSNRWIPQWTGNPNVWDYTGEGYIPWDRSPFGRMSLHSTVVKWAQNILLEDILSKKEYIKNAYEWLDTKFPTVVPNEYYPFGEGQFNAAIRSIVHRVGLTWHEAQIVVDNFWREKRNAGKVTASGRAEREADEDRRREHDDLDEDKKRALTKGLLEEEEQKKVLFNEDSDFPNINQAKWPNELKRIYEPFKKSLFTYWDNKGPHNDPHILKLLGLDTRKERGLYKIIDEWLVEWHGGRDKAVEVAKEKLKGIHQVWDGGYDFKYVVTSIDDEIIPWTKEQKARRKEGLSDHEVGVFVILDGSGIVNLALGGHDSYTVWDIFHDHHWWSDGDYEEECRTCGLRRIVRDDSDDDLTRANRVSDEPDEELKEEVQQEIDEVLYDSLTDLLNETGIGISYVTVKGTTSTYQFPPKEYIHEAADMFGQGLLEPIELQPYDTEEEWEEDVAKIEIPDEDEETDYEEEYEYEGPETDPEIGFVAPSRDVTENICKVRGFCKAQGPITFGQLKALVEAATSKRIASDMGRGIFKSLWRIIPFFLPQVLFAAVGITATRALNKIITPALKDTKGYKRWWGKVVLKAMDIAEGDYIPDVALGDDPLSKIFFVSDGLLEMIRDKYKLKFARYVADVAAAQPDDEPVPEWFVENLLRDYLNQKFLLDPPLGPKHGVDIKKTLREQREEEVSPVLKHGDIVRPIDIPEKREQSSFGPPIPFGLYWVWHPTYGTPKSEGDYIVVPIEDVDELQMSGYLRGGDENEGLPGHLHRHLKVLSRSRNHQWLKVELSDEKKAQYKQEALSRYKRDLLQEHKEPQEVNPPLKTGDVIRIIDIDQKTNTLYSHVIPDLFGVYWVWREGFEKKEQYHIFPWELAKKGFKMSEVAPHVLTPSLGDKWVKVEKESLQEQDERDISPPLEPGDIIKIIEKTDKDSYINLWDEYVVLTPLWHRWGEGRRESRDGYVVMRLDLLIDFNDANLHQDMVVNGHKWLKTGKYKSSIAHLQMEERQKNPSPDLQEGDEIIVLHVDGTHENEPETFVPYKVVERVREPRTKGSLTYHIEPMSGRFPYWDDDKGRWEVENWEEGHGWWSMTTKIIYEVGDEWIFRPGFKKEEEEISEDGTLKHGKSLSPDQNQLIRGFDKWKQLKEHEEKVNPYPIDVGDTITVVAYEDPDVEYMTDDEIKEFMENQEVKDTLQGDWHNFEETADLMGFKWREGRGWYFGGEVESYAHPDLFTPYRIVKKEGDWYGGGEMRYLLLALPEVNKREKMKGKGALDYRWLHPRKVQYIMSPTPPSLQEQQEDSKKVEVNPPLKPGDKIKVIDVDEDNDQRREFMNGMNIITSERFPKLYHTYTVIDNLEEMKWSTEGRGGGSPRYGWTRGYEGSGLDIDEGTQLLWLLMDKQAEEKGRSAWRRGEGTRGEKVGYKVIAPYFDKWIKVEDPEVLQEQSQDKVNPQLMIGDEILVVHTEERPAETMLGFGGIVGGDRDKPALYEPYVVTAIKFRQPENWEGPETDLKYYDLEPIGLTHEERMTQNRGGREKRLYPADRWMHNPDFQREELNEERHREINPELEVGDIIRMIDLSPTYDEDKWGASGKEGGPEIFSLYEVITTDVGNRKHVSEITSIENQKTHPHHYDVFSKPYSKYIYPEDRWVHADPPTTNTVDTLLREELNEERPPHINPTIQRGDVVIVIDLDNTTQGFSTGRVSRFKPQTFIPYRIFGVVHRQRENWEGPQADTRIYQLEPMDITDEERTQDMIVGGGRRRGLRMIPEDKWIHTSESQTISEQDFPFNRDNKKQELDHPKGEPPWSIRRGKQHYAMNVDPTPQEPVTALNNYLVKNSPFNFLGFDYYLSTVPGNMPGEARIDVYIPVLDDSVTADGIWKDTLEFYHENDDEIGWERKEEMRKEMRWEGKGEPPYYMEEIPMRDVGYHAKWPEFYGYDDFYDYHPEVVKQYERRESDYINPDGKVYETSWRERFNLVKDEMKGLAKLFGLENAVINRDPGHPWKRQQDSYGSQDIRPGTDIPYGWPRESEE